MQMAAIFTEKNYEMFYLTVLEAQWKNNPQNIYGALVLIPLESALILFFYSVKIQNLVLL